MINQPRVLRYHYAIWTALVWALTVTGLGRADMTGKEIYSTRCARCHGPNGEGDEKRYPEPLIGDKTVEQLTKLIDETMPEQKPSLCVGKDARNVAQYIYDEFYSREAQLRLAPPRIELARLTVNQHRNAVADLIGGFRSESNDESPSEHGLRGEYFTSRRFRGSQRKLSRIDGQIRFDFKDKSPAPDNIPANEFAIRWTGSVFAPVTGTYDFILRSANGARLWVNDQDRPLIDAWVKSGDGDRKLSIFLLGGRSYPLRLEFFKSERGKEEIAAITLAWKPPHGVDEPIPSRYLSPRDSTTTLVLTTPFPPDDLSYGWVRGTSISKEWDAATTDAAIETANYIVDHLRELAPGGEAQLKDFCQRFVEQAFRHPLSDAERELFVDRQFAEAGDPEIALKRVVLLALKSPRFLYREIGGEQDSPFHVASRLSFGLWDSIPDEELWRAAERGELKTSEQVKAQARRMLADPRAKAKLRGFFEHWLKLEHTSAPSKDPERFPQFTPEVIADLRTSLHMFLDDVVWRGDADLRELFLSEDLFLNAKLAKVYGVDVEAGSEFQKVSMPKGRRAGVLTHPFLMANFAYTAESSPIHRGVFLARGVLGVALKPPQQAFTPLPADLHPNLTTRERVALQTKPASCQACHGVINPLGFSLENFDAVGRFRAEENGKPIDASGWYEQRDGKKVNFQGPRGLAEFLANSGEVHSSFVEQLFHHLVQQPIRAYGPETQTELTEAFVRQEFNIRELMIEIMAASAHRGRSEVTTINKKPKEIANGS